MKDSLLCASMSLTQTSCFFCCLQVPDFNPNSACKLGSKIEFPALARDIDMAEPDEDLQDLLRQLHLPEDVRDALLQNGHGCTLTFGLAFSSMQMLDQHIHHQISPLRRNRFYLPNMCSNPCSMDQLQQFTYSYTTPIPPAQPFPPTPPSTEPSSQLTATSNWHETLPPKLSVEDMETMRTQFAKNCPGEVLDSHSTPSVRLWSLVQQQKTTSTSSTSPSKFRLSEHQYTSKGNDRNKIIQTTSKGNATSLTTICWDDTPEIDINSVRFSRDWLNRTTAWGASTGWRRATSGRSRGSEQTVVPSTALVTRHGTELGGAE